MRSSTPARIASVLLPAALWAGAAPAAAPLPAAPLPAAPLAVVQEAPAAASVVASIKPVYGLVAAVMEGVGVPALLIGGNTSPHTYALRPSEADTVQRARLVFWIGKELETVLAKPLAALGPGARAVPLLEAKGLARLGVREGGVRAGPPFPDLPRDERGEPTAHHWPEPSTVDPHAWLDPAAALVMTAAIADALAAADPANSVRYWENAARTANRLEALERELEALLEPVREVPYVVFHDAFQYFERRFGLNSVAAVTVSPERPPGPRRLAEIRDVIRTSGVRCVFTEPQFPPMVVRTITAGTEAAVTALDPLGVEIPPGPESYFALMRALAQSLHGCLSRPLPG